MRLFPHLFVVIGLSLAAEGTFICYTGAIKDDGKQLKRTKMGISEKNCIACKVDVKVTESWHYELKCETNNDKKCGKQGCQLNANGAACCCEKDLCNGFDQVFGEVIKLITTTTTTTPPTGTGTTTTTPNGTQPSEETTKATVKPTTTGSGMISYSPALLTALLALLSHDF